MHGVRFVRLETIKVFKLANERKVETSFAFQDVRAAFDRQKPVDFPTHRQKIVFDFIKVFQPFFVEFIKYDMFKHNYFLPYDARSVQISFSDVARVRMSADSDSFLPSPV